MGDLRAFLLSVLSQERCFVLWCRFLDCGLMCPCAHSELSRRRTIKRKGDHNFNTSGGKLLFLIVPPKCTAEEVIGDWSGYQGILVQEIRLPR